jgi:hypothetical protein
MPSKVEHIDRAKLNEKFADLVTQMNRDHIHWAVVALFYSALHWVDAFLAIGSVHPEKHFERQEYLSRDPNLHCIIKPYRQLEDDSREARYELASYNDNYVTHLRGLLRQIRNVLEPML